MKLNKKSLPILIGITILASFLIHGMLFLNSLLPVTNSQSEFLRFIMELASFFPLFVPIFLLIAIIILLVSIGMIIFNKSEWKKFFNMLLLSFLYLLVGVPFLYMSTSVHMKAFKALPQKSAPLVNAIKSYQQKYGHPPDKLQNLIPEFLSNIPSTGMLNYPNYEYENYFNDSNAQSEHDGNLWMLKVDAGEMLQFDVFIYYPNQNYPKNGYGGYLEKISDWAYVHE